MTPNFVVKTLIVLCRNLIILPPAISLDSSLSYRNLVVVVGLVVVILDLPVIHFSHENFVVGSVVTFQPGLFLMVNVASDEDDDVVAVDTVLVVVDDFLVVVVSLLLSVDTSSTELPT